MKRNITKSLIGIGICAGLNAQTIITGPSSSQTSYLTPLVASSTITSILTATDVVGGYAMCGLPDGVGAFDNGNGSFTLLMNHEMGNTSGSVRAHGAAGAFVSKWVINKTTLAVVSGADLMQNLNLWTGTTYTTYNATNPSTVAALARFCSGDLPAVSAYYNSTTGRGTTERIYMNGKENGNEGRALAHIVTGTNAGNSYELPYLGKASWENYVACPFAQDKTIVIGMDDSTPGQVYVYVGDKSATGTELVKAGLSGGKLYGVGVLGLLNEGTSVPAANTSFNLINMGAIQNMTGSTLNTNSNNVGVTNFNRPEDGSWDPANPNDFYFLTTNAFAAPSRMWRLRFTDITKPELGGTITAVLDGTEGQKMMDNLTVDNYGHIMIVEDVGGNIHNGKVWQYKIATDQLTLFAEHDVNRFITGASNYLTIDEEASGIIDAQEVLGAGMFITVDQAHYGIPAPIVEGGQLLVLYNPASAAANPEINVQGNNVTILTGNTAISATDNTNFGLSNVGSMVVKTFVIQNAGPGTLAIKSVSVGGLNAGDFAIQAPSAPTTTVAVNGSYTIYVQFNPAMTGARKGMIYITNNDFNESVYSYAVEGTGAVAEIDLTGNNVSIMDGSSGISTSDNTDFGSILYNNAVTKDFTIKNSGNGTLTVSGLNITGDPAFTLLSGPSLPMTLAGNASISFTAQYLPTVANTTNNAMVNVTSTDGDEGTYTYMLRGMSLLDVGVKNTERPVISTRLFPNPTDRVAMLELDAMNTDRVIVDVVDIQGKQVLHLEKNVQAGTQQMELNTSNLAAGEYLVKAKSSTNVQNLKLVVAH